MSYSSVENTVYQLFLGILDCLVQGLCYIYYSWLSMARKPKRDDNRGTRRSLYCQQTSAILQRKPQYKQYTRQSLNCFFQYISNCYLQPVSPLPSFLVRPRKSHAQLSSQPTTHIHTHTHPTPTTTTICRTSRRYRRPSTREIQ
jgi:hypothetical protein